MGLQVLPEAPHQEYETPPPGNHVAVCVAVVDLGRQWQDGFQGADGKFQHRVYLAWELVTKKMTAIKRNHVVGLDLTVSLNEKAKLRHLLDNWGVAHAAGFDVCDLLGRACLLNVKVTVKQTPKGQRSYPAVMGVGGLPDGVAAAPSGLPLTTWLLSDHPAGDVTGLPEWLPRLYGRPLADVIAGCEERGGKKPAAGTWIEKPAAGDPDGIPF